MSEVENLVLTLSNNFTKIITIEEIMKNPVIFWGGNGVGDRFANKKFNYTSINRNRKYRTYSENDDESIDKELIENFLNTYTFKKQGIIGIYVHSHRKNIVKRPIRKDIDLEIKKSACVVCGTNNDIICDHKNDLYNDERVLNSKTQTIDDFQALCNHCNLQKRQISVKEKETFKLFSAKNLPMYKFYNFEFPWEKKAYDEENITVKTDTFWYDPVEFNRKIYLYSTITLPIIQEIKRKSKI